MRALLPLLLLLALAAAAAAAVDAPDTRRTCLGSAATACVLAAPGSCEAGGDTNRVTFWVASGALLAGGAARTPCSHGAGADAALVHGRALVGWAEVLWTAEGACRTTVSWSLQPTGGGQVDAGCPAGGPPRAPPLLP